MLSALLTFVIWVVLLLIDRAPMDGTFKQVGKGTGDRGRNYHPAHATYPAGHVPRLTPI